LIIETIRGNPDKYNNFLVSNTSSSIPIQQSPSWNIEGYKNMILDESRELYDKLLEHFTNSIIYNAAGASSSSDPKLSSMFPRPNQDNTYRRIEEQGSFHNNKGNIAE
jgi:hypothetical protein